MDSYEAALDYLYGFINFEHKSLERYHASKIDPERPRRLLAQLGFPHDTFPSIHIAGTKGKGSVAAMCAACLREAGLRVGLYTSPHLREFRERIRVLTPDDPVGCIPQAQFVSCLERVRPAVEQTPDITWFEIVTAIAFVHFADSAVDCAVVEVGLGGRLDATNVLTPLVSAITSLSLDHTQLLGDTIEQIAYEKGGIIKPGVPVVSANQLTGAASKLREIANERGAPLTFVGTEWRYEVERVMVNDRMTRSLTVHSGPAPSYIPPNSAFRIGLSGEHQVENALVALATLEHVHRRFPGLTPAALRLGLANVQWDGRLQILQAGPDRPVLLVDSAHNDDSAARLVDALTTDYRFRRLMLVFGAPEDKNIAGMLDRLLPLASEVIVTTSKHPRSTTPEKLAVMVEEREHTPVVTHSVAAALDVALGRAKPGDLILVTGSIIVVGELLNQWDTLQSKITAHG